MQRELSEVLEVRLGESFTPFSEGDFDPFNLVEEVTRRIELSGYGSGEVIWTRDFVDMIPNPEEAPYPLGKFPATFSLGFALQAREAITFPELVITFPKFSLVFEAHVQTDSEKEAIREALDPESFAGRLFAEIGPDSDEDKMESNYRYVLEIYQDGKNIVPNFPAQKEVLANLTLMFRSV